jgi:hypothetical protein
VLYLKKHNLSLDVEYYSKGDKTLLRVRWWKWDCVGGSGTTRCSTKNRAANTVIGG